MKDFNELIASSSAQTPTYCSVMDLASLLTAALTTKI